MPSGTSTATAKLMDSQEYDVGIVGAGITGLMVAHALRERGYRVCVFDALEGPGLGVTLNQSEVIHVVQLPFGSLKSKLAREGNLMFDSLCNSLGVPFRRVSALLVVRKRLMLIPLFFAYLYLRIVLRGHFKVRLASGSGVRKIEPNVSQSVKGAIVVGGYGIVDSKRLVLRLYEELAKDVDFRFGCEVLSGKYDGRAFTLTTKCGVYNCMCVVNAGGLYADEVSSRLGVSSEHITPGVGVMAKYEGTGINSIIAPFSLVQNKRTKGGGIIPTVRGTVIFGPNLRDVSDKKDVGVVQGDLDELERKFQPLIKERGRLLRVYAGVRPLSPNGDFLITEDYSSRLINLIGIESPGLTASPALGRLVAERVRKVLGEPRAQGGSGK